ncbi:acetoin utilization protein AcuC [Brachybacterium huguangmaarense]
MTTSAASAPAPAPRPRTGVVWEDAVAAYDFGPGHPMSPVRLELTAHLAREAGLLDRDDVELLPAPVASDAQLAALHDDEYVAAVRAASDPATRPDEDALRPFGIGSEDTPAFDGIHDASARLVGGTLGAVEAIVGGRVGCAVNFTGGMHHARASQAAGFCVYNDAALGILRALDLGEPRVVYVDLDVHHGDGVERALWDEPRAVTISLHESGEVLFPGTGFLQDTGGAGAPGSAVNIPLPPRTGAAGWLRAIDAVVVPLVRAIRPTLLVTQHGCDTHRDDPLADLAVTVEAQVAAMRMMRELADEVCGGRWLALGGGGYAVTDVVPRSWAQLVAVVAGADIDPAAPLPPGYVERVGELARAHGLPVPHRLTTFGDGAEAVLRPWSAGFDPDDDLDRAIQAARRVAFPEWGLDPYYD